MGFFEACESACIVCLFACVFTSVSSFKPVERRWAADHCQSGTELRAHSVSVIECECVFMGER